MDKYEIQKAIGEGSHGKVFKARCRLTGEFVAIKIIKAKLQSWDDVLSLPEIRSLRKIDHPCVVKLKEVINSQNQLFLIYEFIEMSLYRLYRRLRDRKAQFSEAQIRKISHQLLQGIEATHRRGFIHRDIKPENVLIGKDYSVKLSDFGIAREVKSRQPCTEYVSTRWYRAPEMLLHSSAYSTPVDMWAVGCLIAELFLMKPLFAGDSEIDQLSKVFEVLGTPNIKEWPEALKISSFTGIVFPKIIQKPISSLLNGASPEFVSLIECLLKFDPLKRPTAEQALKHPFFYSFLQKEKANTNNIQVSLSSTKTEEMFRGNEPIGSHLKHFNEPKEKKTKKRELFNFCEKETKKKKEAFQAQGPYFSLNNQGRTHMKNTDIQEMKTMEMQEIDSFLPEIPVGLSLSQVYRKPSGIGSSKNDPMLLNRPPPSRSKEPKEPDIKLPSIWMNSSKGVISVTKSTEFMSSHQKFGKLLGNLKTYSHQPPR